MQVWETLVCISVCKTGKGEEMGLLKIVAEGKVAGRGGRGPDAQEVAEGLSWAGLVQLPADLVL